MFARRGSIASAGSHRFLSRSGRRTAVLPFFLLVVLFACGREPPMCPACGRQVHEHTGAILTLQDGTRVTLCCACCAARVGIEGPGIVRGTVHDFETGEAIDIDRAIYVEGSDVHVCRGPILRPLRDDAGGQLLPVYDRCEPSVLAFAGREAAVDFVSRHGGRITDWPALVRARRNP